MSEKEREQNEKSLHEYLNRKAEEQFFRMAAEEIDAEEDRLFAQAQELPDPDDETMARLEAGLQTAMKKARRRAQRRRWLHGLGRVSRRGGDRERRAVCGGVPNCGCNEKRSEQLCAGGV